jgi:protein gp37
LGKTKIEWTEYSWNPVSGCTPASEGCQNCYAKRMTNRLRGRCGYPADEPFKVTLHKDRLEEPLRWKQPRRVFVCSMGDLFHEDVPFEYITQVFDVMCSCSFDAMCSMELGHTFMVLTKRPERIEKWLCWMRESWSEDSPTNVTLKVEGHFGKGIWLGVTAENQQRADERIPILLQIPAAVRFVSVEPMLGPVDIAGHLGFNGPRRMGDGLIYYWVAPKLDWVICGGETGPGARPMHPDWVRSLRDQCQDAGVPFFFKQHGEWLHETQGINFHEGHRYYVWPDESMSFRVGKKAAGRLLDGRTWDEMPEI